MDIDWTTLGLELVNFIVLVWVVRKLLYRPVLAIVDQRRQEVEQVRSEAESIRAQAEVLHARYDERLQRWEEQKRGLVEQANADLARERRQALQNLQAELREEQHRTAVLNERNREEAARHDQEAALGLALRFVCRCCERLASAELTGRLLSMLIEDLPQLSVRQPEAIARLGPEQLAQIAVVSAHRLDGAQQSALREALQSLGLQRGDYTFREDPDLLAGLRVHIGSSVLQASLRDELQFFAGTVADDDDRS